MIFSARGLEMPELTDEERASNDPELPARRAQQRRDLVLQRQERVAALHQELKEGNHLQNLDARIRVKLFLVVSGDQVILARLRQHIENTYTDIQYTLDEAQLTRPKDPN